MRSAFVSPIPLSSRRFHPIKSPRRPTKMVLYEHKPAKTPQSDTITHAFKLLRASPIVLCIRFKDAETAMTAATTVLEGGLRSIEVTMTTPGAPDIIAELRKRYPEALIGAGTVMSLDDVEAVHRAGALFALSPILDPPIIEALHEHGILAVPGAATPTECWHAYRTGAKIVKVFPTNLCGGMDFIKAMQEPLGQIPLMPTFGVSATLLPQYLAEPNVLAVGANRLIFPREAIASGDWETVKERARKWAAVAAEYADTT